jgi:hypothetical protein
MKARALIDGAPFGPDTVKAIGVAFDQASARIERVFDGDTNAAEVARIRLAKRFCPSLRRVIRTFGT